MPSQPRYPNRIRSLRQTKDPTLRQSDLAKRVGCSQSEIAKYERGARHPSLAMALRICQVLSHPLEHVFWGLRDAMLIQVYRTSSTTGHVQLSTDIAEGNDTPPVRPTTQVGSSSSS